jgi:hypothetical protein
VWQVGFHQVFDAEFDELPTSVQDEIYAAIKVLQQRGPQLGRPWVDSLKGSTFANMKEPRCEADGGVWRIDFAFDPRRRAILLVGGDKSGGSEKRFYNASIAKADSRLTGHLNELRSKENRK